MTPAAASAPPPVLLTIDLEDWQQIVARAVGVPAWDEPHDEFRRQAHESLALLRDLGVRATFFVLGMTARHHPDVVELAAADGHEIACHGYWHTGVWTQTPDAFRRDVEMCLSLLERLGMPAPIGYRAPAFSVTMRTPWAFDVLADLGLRYDSSHYDSPKIRDRLPRADAPYRIDVSAERSIWELPIAVGTVARRQVPIGGGSYWRVLPTRTIFDGIERVASGGRFPVLYFHPYELGSRSLRLRLPCQAGPRQRAAAAWYAVRYNPRRSRIPALVADAAERFRLIPCREALQDVERSYGASPRAFPRESAGV